MFLQHNCGHITISAISFLCVLRVATPSLCNTTPCGTTPLRDGSLRDDCETAPCETAPLRCGSFAIRLLCDTTPLRYDSFAARLVPLAIRLLSLAIGYPSRHFIFTATFSFISFQSLMFSSLVRSVSFSCVTPNTEHSMRCSVVSSSCSQYGHNRGSV